MLRPAYHILFLAFTIICFTSCEREISEQNDVNNNRSQSSQSIIDLKFIDKVSQNDVNSEIGYRSEMSFTIGEIVNLNLSEITASKQGNLENKISNNNRIPGYYDNAIISNKPSRFLSITFDNDIFNNTDYYYTNGIIIELFNPRAARNPLVKLLPGIKTADVNNFGFSLQQNIYTPTNPDIPEVSDGDRPFSAFLTIGQIRKSYDFRKRLSVESRINFGVLGPASLGGVVQSSIHNIEPVGWNNQISNTLVIDLSMEVEKGLVSNPNIELNLKAGGHIGTVFNKLEGGLYFRTGRFTPVYKGATSSAFQYWLFIEGASSFVFYDATLQGGIFENNNLYTIHNKDINRLVLKASFGLAVYYNNIGIELQNFYISPEFRNAYDFRWGRIKIVFKI